MAPSTGLPTQVQIPVIISVVWHFPPIASMHQNVSLCRSVTTGVVHTFLSSRMYSVTVIELYVTFSHLQFLLHSWAVIFASELCCLFIVLSVVNISASFSDVLLFCLTC